MRCKAYIACQIELEEALNVLVNRLAAEGKLDDTLIVLSGDHYPYGLTHEQIEELNGSPVDENFELYHSTLIIWNSAMATEGKTVEVEKPCYSVDILPTLCNLFGVPYDSRLLVGRDVFSDSEAIVIWPDYNWKTKFGYYNYTTRKFVPVSEEISVEELEEPVFNIFS